jgi:hypothetical protein
MGDRITKIKVNTKSRQKNTIKNNKGSYRSRFVKNSSSYTSGGGGPIVATKRKSVNKVKGQTGSYRSKFKQVTLNKDGSATLSKNTVRGQTGRSSKRNITTKRANRMINRWSK